MDLPTWLVQYDRRRPTLIEPLRTADHSEIEVAAIDEAGAEAAFRQRFPACCTIRSISLKPATGFA